METWSMKRNRGFACFDVSWQHVMKQRRQTLVTSGEISEKDQ